MSYESERLNELLGSCQGLTRKLLDLADEVDHLGTVKILPESVAGSLRKGLIEAADRGADAYDPLLTCVTGLPRTNADQNAWSVAFDDRPLTDDFGRPYCGTHDDFGCGPHVISDPVNEDPEIVLGPMVDPELQIERDLP